MGLKVVGDNIPLSKIQEAKEKGERGVNVVTMKDPEAEISIKDLQNQLNMAIVTVTQMIMTSNASGDSGTLSVPPIPKLGD